MLLFPGFRKKKPRPLPGFVTLKIGTHRGGQKQMEMIQGIRRGRGPPKKHSPCFLRWFFLVVRIPRARRLGNSSFGFHYLARSSRALKILERLLDCSGPPIFSFPTRHCKKRGLWEVSFTQALQGGAASLFLAQRRLVIERSL